MSKSIFVYLSLLLAIGVFFIGCIPSGSNGREGTRQKRSAIEFEAPNTKVDVGKEGVKVDTPSVDIKVGGGDGVKVDAPGTHVDLGGDTHRDGITPSFRSTQ